MKNIILDSIKYFRTGEIITGRELIVVYIYVFLKPAILLIQQK